jgi:hypothetical protein
MTTPRSESEAVAARLAQAAERLKAQQAAGGAPASDALNAEDALLLLKTLCAELRDTDLEIRRARSRIAQLAADAAARRAPPEAA